MRKWDYEEQCNAKNRLEAEDPKLFRVLFPEGDLYLSSEGLKRFEALRYVAMAQKLGCQCGSNIYDSWVFLTTLAHETISRMRKEWVKTRSYPLHETALARIKELASDRYEEWRGKKQCFITWPDLKIFCFCDETSHIHQLFQGDIANQVERLVGQEIALVMQWMSRVER